MSPRPILPGAAVGVLGSGQLGRMFAIAARRMGYRVHTFSPDTDTPTGQVADIEIVAPYEDLDAVRRFARQVRAVTFEFENVPAATAAAAAACSLVRPHGDVLHTTQHRLREKRFLSANGFPVAPFREIRSAEDMARAVTEIGPKAILKTAGFGYDGKGQIKIHAASAAPEAWRRMGGQECVLEQWIDFSMEVSVVAARGTDGTIVDWGVVENEHKNHILDLTIAPGRVPPPVAKQARDLAHAILEKLDVVGVTCVEFFVTQDERVLINEIAPRPHNSGHFTFDACVTSQFEQQLRAVCGLPLGSTELLRPAAMANLMGDLWDAGEPDWPAALAMPEVKLHLYGKTSARPGRKMGHLTAMAATEDAAAGLARAARSALTAR
ncbi:MAG: 5-(carboxyamino)imidazole ribonucleotide synthase [Acidobacteria bacterium]|nr:5-(carboxyamino)imidazole ribonucleotide synthase [Acidobacteriota bacterium]